MKRREVGNCKKMDVKAKRITEWSEGRKTRRKASKKQKRGKKEKI